MSSLRRFTKDAFVYSLAGWLSRGFGIILIPIYTRVFSTAEYGTLDLIAAFTAFLSFGLQFGLDSAVTRYYSAASDESEKKAFFSTVFWVKIFSYGPILLACIFASPVIANVMFGNADHQVLLIWALTSVLTSSIWSYLQNLYRLQFKSVYYSVASIAYLLINAGLTIYFVVFARTGIIGVYWAKVIADVGLVSLVLLHNSDYVIKPEFARLPLLLKFGLPLVPSAIAYYLMQYLDRYFIQFYWGESELGLYAIAYRLTSVLVLITAGFTSAWAPFVWSVYDKANGPRTIKIVFKVVSLGLILLAFGLGVFAREILVIFATPDYVPAASVTYIVAFGLAIFRVMDRFCVGIGGSNKNHHRLWAGIMAALANFGLNWLLIPRFGIAGAAWATLISYVIYSAYVMYISQQLYPVEYGLKRYAVVVIVFLICSSIFSTIEQITFQMLFIKIWGFLIVGLLTPFLVGFISMKEFLTAYNKLKMVRLPSIGNTIHQYGADKP